MVTHYAKPSGYAFGRRGLQRPGGPDPPRPAGTPAQRQSAGRRHRGEVPNLTSCHLQAPALAATGEPGARTTARATSLLPAQPGAAESGGPVARSLPGVLELKTGGPEVVRRIGRAPHNQEADRNK